MSVQQKNHSEKNNKMAEIDDQILRSFDIKKRLGKGAYGIVWKAIDKKTHQTVAVKKIFDAFRNETDAQRTFREIMFLRAFRNHPNIVQLHSIHRAVNHMDIYLSFEFMESDLHNVIKRGSILKDIHKRFVMYQLLNATQYIHSGNVIHRDMKPSNVLVDSKCRCKIADFGLARSIGQQHPNNHSHAATPDVPEETCLTDYVATRWYRAPEILVASKKYTMGIDMWSLGCILGEMIRAKPLFPGSCTMNQIERIVSAMPHVTDRDIQSIGGGFGTALLTTKATNATPNPSLEELLVGSPDDARELVQSLLVLDPMRRLTAKQALGHRYIEKFRNTSPECELNADIVPPFRDDVQLTVSEYRSKLYEIMSAHEKNGYVGKRLDKKDQQLLESSLTVQPSMPATHQQTLLPPSNSQTKNHQFVRPTVNHTMQSTNPSNTRVANTTTTTTTNGKQQFSNSRGGINPPKNGVSCPNAFARAVAVSHPNKISKNLSSQAISASNLTTDEIKGAAAARRSNFHYESLDDNLFRATAQRLRSSAAVIAGGPDHRRNSLDTYSTGKLLAKTTIMGAGASEPIAVERRRQSLIDADPPPVKQIREASQPDKRLHQDACSIRLVPSMSKHKLLSLLNARATVGPPLKPPRSNISCFKTTSPPSPPFPRSTIDAPAQPPPRPVKESSIDARLRMLEEEVRKHSQKSVQQADQLKSASTRHQQQKTFPLPSHSDPFVASGSSVDRPLHLARSRSGTYAARQPQQPQQQQQQQQHRPSRIINRYQLTDIGGSGDHAGQPRLPQRHNFIINPTGSSNNNYGAVRANDFHSKLRSSEVTS